MDPLTLLIIVLIALVLVSGYGSSWHQWPPYALRLFGVLFAFTIILIVVRLLGPPWAVVAG